MLKQINNVETFVDDDYKWILHEGSPQTDYYKNYNTLHYQVFDVDIPYIKKFAEETFKIYSISFVKQLPGMVIPLHTDKYWFFKSKYKFSEDKIIYRTNIFLEDWKSGHYFEANNEPVVKWKAGQYVLLDTTIFHRSGNIGDDPKYTAQITGLLLDSQAEE